MTAKKKKASAKKKTAKKKASAKKATKKATKKKATKKKASAKKATKKKASAKKATKKKAKKKATKKKATKKKASAKKATKKKATKKKAVAKKKATKKAPKKKAVAKKKATKKKAAAKKKAAPKKTATKEKATAKKATAKKATAKKATKKKATKKKTPAKTATKKKAAAKVKEPEVLVEPAGEPSGFTLSFADAFGTTDEELLDLELEPAIDPTEQVAFDDVPAAVLFDRGSDEDEDEDEDEDGDEVGGGGGNRKPEQPEVRERGAADSGKPAPAIPSFGPPPPDRGQGDRGRGDRGQGDRGQGDRFRRRRRRGRRRGRGRPRRHDGPPTLEDARYMARRRFKINRLHPEQEEAIEALLAGRDTIAVLPTGYGKSLIYQIPALLLDKPVICVSPLIALMRDQEKSLRQRGAPVVRLDSTLKAAERRAAYERIAQGGRLIVLTTPETLESEQAKVLRETEPAILCVDEAHCISEWGHDFRPAYLRLGVIRQQLNVGCVLALTATATHRVQENVAERLKLVDPKILVAPPHRHNLRLSVEIVGGQSTYNVTADLLKRLRRPGIIYCATTKAVDGLHAALTRTRIPCEKYHGRMKAADRTDAQRRFMKSGKQKLMIATNAFGMGVDKADIRYIVHFQTPGSIESYVQEAGRAGRDGRTSDCILLFDPSDLKIQRYLTSQGRPKPAQLRRTASALLAWAEEQRPVNTTELALSAGQAQTTARSMCAELEQVGLLHRDEKRRYVLLKSPAELIAGTTDLAKRFENLKEEDEKRLLAMHDYATSEECRSRFIRRWFGEEDPPECGRCDRCRIKHGRESPLPKAGRGQGDLSKRGHGGKRRRGKRRRGRGRGGRGRGRKRQQQPTPPSDS